MVALCALLVFLFGTFLTASASPDRVVCYFASWSVYRPTNGKFTVEDIDPTLCDHLVYAFVGIDPSDGSIRILDEQNDITNGAIVRFNALKELSPSTQTSVAIGGWSEGSVNYSEVVSDPNKRKKLISDAVDILQTYGFDGFDLDWEFPGERGGTVDDKANLAQLIKEFREEFDKHGFLLTAAVAPTGATVDRAYDVPTLSKYLDYIHVMTYNLNGPVNGITGENAPLYPSHLDTAEDQKLQNVQASIEGWIARGADPAKLLLGISEYGKSFTLSNSSNTDLGAPSDGPGNPGPYNREAGTLSYTEICEMLQEGGWTVVWNDEQQVPYAYKGDQWIGYDNLESYRLKVEFAKRYGLGGFKVWEIAGDDFRGLCGMRYPVLNTIRSALQESSSAGGPIQRN